MRSKVEDNGQETQALRDGPVNKTSIEMCEKQDK